MQNVTRILFLYPMEKKNYNYKSSIRNYRCIPYDLE